MTNATVPGGLEARPPAGRSASNGNNKTPPPPPHPPSALPSTRVRLAGTVDAISDRVKPANVARRCVASVKAQFVEPDGELRTTRVAVLAVVTAGAVAALMWRRRH
jgi:hypothetical protein